MAVHTKWRFQISVSKPNRLKALYLQKRGGFKHIGDWMRHVLKKEMDFHFPAVGLPPADFEDFAEKHADEALVDYEPSSVISTD